MSKEIIKVGQLEIRFLLDSKDTNGTMSLFEFLVPAGAKVPLPHYHEAFDEAAYVLEGTMTFIIDGKTVDVGPGESCFIPKGIVHGFDNLTDKPSKALSVLTPAIVGPDYFIELGNLLSAGGPPDPVKVKEVMKKYGLVAVPPKS
ncbi:cupin domain-containing protein [Flavobacterium silvaticum]|uniref:Cupin domain-containing protein n=1 Tax=Flavobacterium silvaticum TaxID=1852020 RepID=A0A972JI86_9FLAO|nr:cupin domain-containing protein [Flavobacterium silvaticum]NMH27057.1 cupin domain-containing protein [Flavobacterium silvaticum]